MVCLHLSSWNSQHYFKFLVKNQENCEDILSDYSENNACMFSVFF